MRYRAEIDGLRALAVLGVLVYHFGLSIAGRKLLPGGYLGVDVFFVISGYLITRMLIVEVPSRRYLVGFYERRVRRLLPALYTVCALSLLSGIWVLPPAQLVALAKSTVAAILFVANFYFHATTDYWADAASHVPLLHLWSLAVEEQFYFVFPLLFIALGTRKRSIAMVLITVFAVSLTASLFLNADRLAGFYMVWFRAWELLAGSLIAIFQARHLLTVQASTANIASALGLTILLFAFSFGGKYGANVAAVTGAAMVIAFSQPGGRVLLALSYAPLVFVGLISYPLYLVHQPLLAFVRFRSINDITQLERLALMGIAVGFAWLIHRLIETPFRHSGATGRNLWGWAVAGSVALFFASLVIIQTKGLPQRYTDEQRALLIAVAYRGTDVLKAQNCKTRTTEDTCRLGAANVSPTWAILGDSHAETLSDALSAEFAARNVAAEVLTYPGCPFIVGAEAVVGPDTCAPFADAVMRRLEKNQIRSVIIHDRGSAYIEGTRFDNGEGGVEPGEPFAMQPKGRANLPNADRISRVNRLWKETMLSLLDRGIRVIYIAPVPEVGWHVPNVSVRLAGQGKPSITTSRARYFERHRELLALSRQLEAFPDYMAIYPEEVFCDKNSNRCYTQQDGKLFYTDTDHLSGIGARRLVDRLMLHAKARSFIPAMDGK